MPIEINRWVWGSAIIENLGVPRDESRRLGLLPALLEMPLAQTALVATAVGRNNAPAAQPTTPGTPPTTPGTPPTTPGTPPTSQVTLPNVTGQPFGQAESTLNASQLQVVRQDVNDTSRGEVVLVQVPDPGTSVPSNSVVTLIVGQDPPQSEATVDVPNVIGRQWSDAEQLLTSLQLQVARQEVSVMIQGEAVLGQVPDPGTSVPRDSVVTLIVGQDAPSSAVRVPDVLGKQVEDAENILGSVQLSIFPRPIMNEHDQPGTVRNQNPQPDTYVPVGTVVVLDYSSTPES